MAKLRIALLVLLVALAAGACGSNDDNGSASDTTAAASGGKTATIVLKDLKFDPDEVSVQTGGTVTWKWEENVLHNVTGKDGSFKSDNKSDGTFTHTFDKAGTYKFECTLHTGMTGQVTVS